MMMFEKKRAVFSFIISIMISLSIYVGYYLQNESSVNVLIIIAVLILLTVVVYLLYGWIDTLKIKLEIEKKEFWLYFSIAYILFIFMFLPSFIAAFPGVFSYDAPHQLWQVFSPEGSIRNNQPVISTFFLSGIMYVGKVLFGSWENGLTIYIIIQILLFSGTFSFVLTKYVLPYGKAPFFVLVVLIGLYPANQLFVVNAAKDVIYALLVLWTIIVLFDIIKKSLNDVKISNLEYMAFFVFELLVMLWRNNSVYALVIAAPFILLVYRKKVFKLLSVCGVTVLIYISITNFLFPAVGIQGSVIVESLAIPEQQMVNVYVNKRDTLSDEQAEFIENVMPEGFADLYNPTNSDTIRPRMNIDYIEEIGMITFVKEWVAIGIDNPLEYVKAFLNNTRGYWYLFYEFSRVGSDRYIEYENFSNDVSIGLDRYMWDTDLSDFYYKLSDENILGKYPFVSYLFSIAFSFWMFIILAGYTVYRKRKELYVVYIFMGSILLTLLLGPLSLMRYIYPFTIALPFLLFTSADKQNNCGSS